MQKASPQEKNSIFPLKIGQSTIKHSEKPYINDENRPRRLCSQALIDFSKITIASVSETTLQTEKESRHQCDEQWIIDPWSDDGKTPFLG